MTADRVRASGAYEPFVIEVYEDWSDYPNWTELEVEGLDETPRFASIADARIWLSAYLDAQDQESLRWWYEREEKARQAQEVYAKRLAVLEREGLAQHDTDWRDGPLSKPQQSYKKPMGVDRRKYRVALDGPKCPTCGTDANDDSPADIPTS